MHDLDAPSGATGQLIERLVVLLNQELDQDPHWWFTVGTLAGACVGYDGFGEPGEVPRDRGFAGLRSRLWELVTEVQVDERFLVQSIVRDLDGYMVARADTREHDERAGAWRRHLTSLLEDPIERDRWRERDEELRHLDDRQMLARLHQQLDHPLAQQTTVEGAASRWAMLERWRGDLDVLLSDKVFKQWLLEHLTRDPDD